MAYARFFFRKNSRRLRVASIVKTVNNETTNVEMNVSMPKSYRRVFIMHLRAG